MRQLRRNEFLSWFETREDRGLGKQARVSPLLPGEREGAAIGMYDVSQTLLQIRNWELFIEYLTIAAACYKVFHENFLQPDRKKMIQFPGCMDNREQRRMALA